MERALIPANPIEIKAAKHKPQPKDKKLPETSTLHAVIDHAPARYRFVLMLCLFMGLRVGEAIALKRKHLHNRGTDEQPRWVVDIRGNLQRMSGDNGVYLQWQPPKTAAGRRDVPILTQFNTIVSEHLEYHAPGGVDDYLTATAAGKPVFDTSLRSVLQRALVRAGYPHDVLTLHYGRNWLITHLAQLGATPAEIGYLLGQSDLKTITETYMKVRPDNLGKVMGRLDGELSGEVVVLSQRREQRAGKGA